MFRARLCVFCTVSAALLAAAVPAARSHAQGGMVDTTRVEQADKTAASLKLRACRVVPVQSAIMPAGLIGSATGGTLAFEAAPGVYTTFTLEPYSMRAADFKLMISDDAGTHEVPAPAPTTYHGRSDAGDEVWASIYQSEVHAIVRTAAAPLNLLYVQPLPPEAAPGADPDALHVVYAASDMIPTGHTCGVDECPPCQSPATGGGMLRSSELRGAPIPCRYVRLNVDADYPMYHTTSADVGATVRLIEMVMLGVNQQYLAATFVADIRFTIPRITVRTTAAGDPYASVPLIGGSINTLLDLTTSTWPPAAASRDLTHLFTGRDTAGSAIGLAWLGVVCGGFNTGLSQPYFTGILGQRIQLTAHEIGHNFNMSHDASGAPYIMAPAVSDPASTTFSPASHIEANAFLASRPACALTVVPDVQADGATTIKNRAIRIDVLANDGRAGVACPTTVTSFTLPGSATTLGGTVSVSAGTGPGGRNEVLYTPPTNVDGATDSFNYVASGVTVPVVVDLQTPRPPEGLIGQHPGFNTTYYDSRPMPGAYWVWEIPPTEFSAFPVHSTPTLTQLNYSGALPGFTSGFSAVMTGYIRIPTAGLWTFTLNAGNTARLYFGSDPFLLAPMSAGAAARSSTRAFAAGLHAFRIEYYQGPNPAQLKLAYNAEGQPSTVIPGSAYFKSASNCRADFNQDGFVTIDDIFVFLNAWFAGSASANIDGVGGVEINDIFVFLNLWFAGC